jgi:hypothetical protein
MAATKKPVGVYPELLASFDRLQESIEVDFMFFEGGDHEDSDESIASFSVQLSMDLAKSLGDIKELIERMPSDSPWRPTARRSILAAILRWDDGHSTAKTLLDSAKYAHAVSRSHSSISEVRECLKSLISEGRAEIELSKASNRPVATSGRNVGDYTVAQRFYMELSEDHTRAKWTARKWATYLGCSTSTVGDVPLFKQLVEERQAKPPLAGVASRSIDVQRKDPRKPRHYSAYHGDGLREYRRSPDV